METFLLVQLIYAGKTDGCHRNGINFPEGFNVTHTPNHWSCEKSAIEHLTKVVFPHLSKKQEQLKMPKDQKALLIFDVFKGQTTQQVKDVIRELKQDDAVQKKRRSTRRFSFKWNRGWQNFSSLATASS